MFITARSYKNFESITNDQMSDELRKMNDKLVNVIYNTGRQSKDYYHYFSKIIFLLYCFKVFFSKSICLQAPREYLFINSEDNITL